MFFDERHCYRVDNANMLRQQKLYNRRKWEIIH
jgi:hypothetical protein